MSMQIPQEYELVWMMSNLSKSQVNLLPKVKWPKSNDSSETVFS
jgi:hypothetical protein